MAVLYTNNASSALSAPITNVATSFSVTAGAGALFPAISGGDYFYATLIDIAGNIEIVKVTGRATDTFTVVRAQDGTTARAFSSGDKVELRITKGMLDDVKTDTKSSLTSLNVTTALGFTPYNATNPSGYITSSASITGSSYRIAFLDTRATNDQPQNKTGYALSADFKSAASVDTPPVQAGNGYAHVLTVAGWDTGGGSGGWPSQLSVGAGIAIRQGTSATAWGAWKTLLDSSNYNSYAPTLTGTGASGSWGISITGTAASISGFNNPSTAPTASTIVYRDSAGDIAAREIVLSSTLSSATPTVLVSMYPTTNQLVRTTPAAVAAAIQAAASGTWDINISGNAATVTNGITTSNYSSYALPLSGGTLTGATKIKAGHTDTRFQLHYNHDNADTTSGGASYLTLWASEPGISYAYSGIGGNINIGGQHYGRATSGQPYGLYLRFNVSEGLSEFWSTTGAVGETGGQGTRRAYIDASGDLWATSNAYKVLHAGNYNSYAPTLTGGGASGTWGINITGNAATATNSSYSNNITQGFNSNWNTDFSDAPAGSTILRGDTSSGSSTGGPGGTWWFQQNMRHGNSSNVWGVQVAWGWEDNANTLRTRNVSGGSYSGWVTYLNSSNYNSYALPLSGGALTGGLREARVAMGANNIDLSTGNYFTKTISGATSLTVSNVPAAGTAASFILDLTNGGSATITWWGVKWAGGTAPTLTAAGRDVLGFFTHDGGTTWTGLVLGKDVK